MIDHEFTKVFALMGSSCVSRRGVPFRTWARFGHVRQRYKEEGGKRRTERRRERRDEKRREEERREENTRGERRGEERRGYVKGR